MILKWVILLIVVASLVFGFSSKQIRTPILAVLNKFKWQILATAIIFSTALFLALLGT